MSKTRQPDGPTEIQYKEGQPHLVLRTAIVRVIAGPDEGLETTLGLGRVSVGSDADNSLALTDPLVSRHHCEIQLRDRGYLVLDQESTNGTFFRGARIREALLQPGAQFRIGASTLRIERGKETSSVIRGKGDFGRRLIGTSPAMQEVYGILSAVAPTDATVVLRGETGTGKELVAEEIHRQSYRRDNRLVIVDCGSIPESLIESELFGHRRGAFTGAVSDRDGAFVRAAGGTILLDEIAELPLEMQTRLLRVLDTRTVRRVGDDQERSVDVRVIAATHRDLPALVEAGRFRQDLYFRLSVVSIFLPPLRERREDIPSLARRFLWQAGCPDPDGVLRPEVVQLLTTREWPGNVRELRNVIERATVFGGASQIGLEEHTDDTPAAEDVAPLGSGPTEWIADGMPSGFLDQTYKRAKEQILGHFEVLYLEHLISRHGMNISRIAADARLDRHHLRILLRKHGLDDRNT
jgi:DNA-binding NtrC family response regulator